MKTLALCVVTFLNTTALAGAWRQFETPTEAAGSTVKLSDSGMRMAIGSPAGDGIVSLYEMDPSNRNWNLLASIEGTEREGMGDFIAMSPDGNLFAIRRYHVTPSVVQVYQTTPLGLQKIGSDVFVADADGQSITLGQASASPREGVMYYLIVGCESFDNDRGKVQAFRLISNHASGQAEWESFLRALEGKSGGDRFGAATSFAEAPSPLFASSRVFRIAVSAPSYNDDSGLVQIFTADEEDGWSQFGDDMYGVERGERFGASIAMSGTEDPYLVIGSPSWGFSQGAVQLVHWRSVTFRGPYRWHVVGDRLEGAALNRRAIGKSVAITGDGGRAAFSSAEIDGAESYISVIDRATYDDSFLTVTETRGGFVALNYPGSVLAVASGCLGLQDGSFDRARVLFDDSAFCALPTQVADGGRTKLEIFLTRAVCRSGTTLLADAALCGQTRAFIDGQFVPCQWIAGSPLRTEAPYDTPATLPPLAQTKAPSFMPSPLQSDRDTLTPLPDENSGSSTSSPSDPESSNPSSHPVASSQPPSHAPSATPSKFPSPRYATLSPSDSPYPSQIPTTNTDLPTQSRNGIPSQNPSGFPPPQAKDKTETSDSHGFSEGTRARACHCDALGRCINNPLVKGSTLSLCVDIGQTNLLVNVVNCNLQQGKTSVVAIEDSLPQIHGAFSNCIDGFCEIRTTVDSAFFEDGEDYLVVTGSLGIVDARSRHLRRSKRLLSDNLQYSVVVVLKNMIASESTTTSGIPDGDADQGKFPEFLSWLLLGILLFCMLVFLCWYFRHKSRPKPQ